MTAPLAAFNDLCAAIDPGNDRNAALRRLRSLRSQAGHISLDDANRIVAAHVDRLLGTPMSIAGPRYEARDKLLRDEASGLSEGGLAAQAEMEASVNAPPREIVKHPDGTPVTQAEFDTITADLSTAAESVKSLMGKLENFAAFDKDGDGRPGGSLKVAALSGDPAKPAGTGEDNPS